MRAAAALMIAVFAMTTSAFAAPTSATKTHHPAQPAPSFSMSRCLKAAERIYGPAEARAACVDLKFGV